jgi:hypothetical protein
MTLYEFNMLDEIKQTEAVWNKSVHIGNRSDEEHDIKLYQIDNFYLEIYRHREYDVVRRFRTFLSVDQLQPYLAEIDIQN